MCLKVVHNKKFTGNKGWKILRKGGDCCPKYFTGLVGRRIEVTDSAFARADNTPLHVNSDRSKGTYPGGFHMCTRRADAVAVINSMSWKSSYALCRVQFKKQVAYGLFRWSTDLPLLRAVVAQECKILQVMP